ncbi:hypothetical protein DRE_04288 [Drechslerella stenobrocha 248]|uniref:Methyltransferase domain-containing protein n=1 Tax=Drechslerella stenobrocha 248 TaxID=1043628 RepID=W7IBW9_9PEZI|nr:hypothetical protein DRE_04288 [Drechslerella stenobrocha 248]
MSSSVRQQQPAEAVASGRISTLVQSIYRSLRRRIGKNGPKNASKNLPKETPTDSPNILSRYSSRKSSKNSSRNSSKSSLKLPSLIDESTARSRYWVEEPPINNHPDAVALIRHYRADIEDTDRMIRLLKEIRLKAWKIKHYPCVGQWLFFKFGMTEHAIYPEVIERLQQGQRILDMGCFMGFDGRKLIADGAPSEGITNMDLEDRWFPLSFELFKDEDTFKGEFFGDCDINDPELFEEGSIHRHRYDMIYVGYFIHLFPPSHQPKIIANLAQLLKPDTGSMIFGNTSGTAKENGYLMKADFGPPTTNEKGETVRPDFMFHSTKTIVDLMARGVKGDGEWDFTGEQSPIDLDLSPTKAYAQHFKDVELVNMNFCMRRTSPSSSLAH